ARYVHSVIDDRVSGKFEEITKRLLGHGRKMLAFFTKACLRYLCQPMKRTIRTLALAVVLFVIGGVAIVTFREPGPRYHSHALGYWLGELASNDVESQTRARDAFREMGTNAYPFLMERL